MSQTYIPIQEAVLGVIRGRDAIYLDKIELDYPKHKIIFRGSLNGLLLEKEFRYELMFRGLLMLRMTELDFSYEFPGESCFDEVVNSEWIENLRKADGAGKVSAGHRHFVLSTYDDVFELISLNYELQLTPLGG